MSRFPLRVPRLTLRRCSPTPACSLALTMRCPVLCRPTPLSFEELPLCPLGRRGDTWILQPAAFAAFGPELCLPFHRCLVLLSPSSFLLSLPCYTYCWDVVGFLQLFHCIVHQTPRRVLAKFCLVPWSHRLSRVLPLLRARDHLIFLMSGCVPRT